jgi:hypothetical protein
MAEMGDVNFLILNRIENKIAKTRYNNHALVRLIDFAALIRRIGQFHCPIEEPRNNAGSGSRAVFADVGVNTLEIVERGGV